VAYLFGNILSVQSGDVVPLAVLSVVALGLMGYFFKELLFLGVDEEAARAAGVPTTALQYMLLTLLAVTIVAAVRLVGIVLVSAFLVIPAATGQALGHSLRSMMIIGVTSAVASVMVGLWLSWAWDLPSGAAVVLVAAALYFLALVTGRR
jgi:ABC-type Mn2+/Zn2+ transport system permease subunit